MVHQSHFAWPRHVAQADQSHAGDRVMGGAIRARDDPRRTVAHGAGDAMDALGLKGLGQGYRRQDSGESPRQHRLARPRGA
jgi:hypothetical protein